MLRCGGAVLASTADSLVEVLQDHAALIDPLDEVAWTKQMLQILTDDEFHTKLTRNSEAFSQRYTWTECAKRTWQVFRTLRKMTR
jgi:alpha-1,3-rhamnosyl/mannosyltransferase